ncbi:hypothetical protein GCM10010274_62350 [Streptomyces lavendofoliae]|uniref:Uncharacterized protein n=1 Tax=Streptomyces lavendofoliae TaxID=67314 RepID=A0A918M810_9ACTN|nr:hypothetical protein GCM10010274_62350 [Streptomyces lavendofoliae]
MGPGRRREGTDGAFPTVEGGREVVRRARVSAEFRAFAGGGTSPVTLWLRGLVRRAHAACGGPGVGRSVCASPATQASPSSR